MFEITDEFLVQAGFDMLDGAQKEQLKKSVSESVQNKITHKIMRAVGADRLQEFVNLLESSNMASVMEWCRSNKVDLPSIVQDSMNEAMTTLQQLRDSAFDMITK